MKVYITYFVNDVDMENMFSEWRDYAPVDMEDASRPRFVGVYLSLEGAIKGSQELAMADVRYAFDYGNEEDEALVEYTSATWTTDELPYEHSDDRKLYASKLKNKLGVELVRICVVETEAKD